MLEYARLPLLALPLLTTLASSLPGYLQFDIKKQAGNSLARRQVFDGVVDAAIEQDSNKLEYLIKIANISVTIDTGSSDLWIPAASSSNCRRGKCDEGQFDEMQSSTYKIVEQSGFNITYAGPGDSDAGDWATDTISVAGGPDMTDVQFGLALEGYDTHGVMGIGYDTNEAYSPGGKYPSIMDQMVSQGLIQRKAYALFLNNLHSDTGSLIFGGVDTSKYTGELIGLPFQIGPYGNTTEFFVTLTSVSITDDGGQTTQLTPGEYAQSVLLDSGTSATLLTNDLFERLVKGFGAVQFGQYGSLVVPCTYQNSKAMINYSFGGPQGLTVKVPISQLIGQEYFNAQEYSDPSGGCDLGFGPPIDGCSILGDTFLRSAYAVFDLDNNIAALGQARLDQQASSPQISVISSGTGLPGARMTLSATGTQLMGAAATSSWSPPFASTTTNSIVLAGSPTFKLGTSSSSRSGASCDFKIRENAFAAMIALAVMVSFVG